MKGRRNLKWQQMDKSSIKLSKLIEFYETFNRSEGKSSRTVEWYNEVLNLFHNWLKSEKKKTNLGSISEIEVRGLIFGGQVTQT